MDFPPVVSAGSTVRRSESVIAEFSFVLVLSS